MPLHPRGTRRSPSPSGEEKLNVGAMSYVVEALAGGDRGVGSHGVHGEAPRGRPQVDVPGRVRRPNVERVRPDRQHRCRERRGAGHECRCIHAALERHRPVGRGEAERRRDVVRRRTVRRAGGSIIERYRKKDLRIKVYRNEKTIPMEDNLNLSAQYCSDNSEWIKYAFSDDYLFPIVSKKWSGSVS